MGAEECRCRSGDDRISGLPDELLHAILVRLGSAHAAARTSVLSRRWRHVWAHLPELRFAAPREAAPGSSMDAVDAALGGYLAPTLERLGVHISPDKRDRDDLLRRFTAGRVAPWLHFAAEHAVGELSLFLFVSFPTTEVPGEEEEVVLELPVCQRAKQICFFLAYAHPTWLRPQQASGSGLQFRALTCLKIAGYVRMEGSDVTALVCTQQCPCLRDLSLSVELISVFDVSIHSNSMRTMQLCVSKTRRLEVMAPRLEELTIDCYQPTEAHISAPKLVKLHWNGAYDPHLNRFVDVGRTLRLLKTYYYRGPASVAKRFDEVDELDLTINLDYLPSDVAMHGRSFLNETHKLPKCKRISVFLPWEHHAAMRVLLHLLRSCNGTKKFRVSCGCAQTTGMSKIFSIILCIAIV